MPEDQLLEYLVQRIEGIDKKVDDLGKSINEKIDQHNLIIMEKVNGLSKFRGKIMGGVIVISFLITAFFQVVSSYLTK